MSRLLRAVVFAAASLSILSPNALAASWSSPVTVAPAAGPISSSYPVVASDSAGKLTAIWLGDGSVGLGIYSSTRGNLSTDAWSSPIPISATGGAAKELQLDVNASGQAVAGWIDYSVDSAGDITANRIVTVNRTAGGTWSAPTPLGESGAANLYTGHRLVVEPSGKAVGAWARGNEDNDTYETGAITQGGGAPALSAGPVATGSESSGGSPLDLAIDASGNATLVYLNDSGLGVFSSTRPAGGSWGTPQKIDQWTPESGASFPSLGQPRVAVNASGTAVASWIRTSDESSGLFASVRTAGGTWSAPATLQSRGTADFVSDSVVGIDGAGRATALWSSVQIKISTAGFEFSSVVRSSSAAAGGSWDAAQARSQTSGTLYSGLGLSVADNGDTAAVWTNTTSETFAGVESAVRRAGKGWENWSTVANIAPSADGSPLASITVTPASEAVVVYATTRNVRATSTALVDPPAPAPEPGPGPTPAPTPQSSPTPAPPVTPGPGADQSLTPPDDSIKEIKKSVPQLKIVMYMVPRGKSCPRSAKGKIGKTTTKLRMRKVRKTVKKKRRTLCKVTGTIKVPASTEVGKVYKIKVTAKRVKSKNVNIAVTD